MRNFSVVRIAALAVTAGIVATVAIVFSTMSPHYLTFRAHLVFCVAGIIGSVLGWRGKLDVFAYTSISVSAFVVGLIYVVVITRVGRTIFPTLLEYLFLLPIPVLLALGIAGLSGVAVAITRNGARMLGDQTYIA